MLDDSPSLRAFVERMTRINKGRALYTRPDRLGEYLLVDYLGRQAQEDLTPFSPPRGLDDWWVGLTFCVAIARSTK